MGGSLGSLFSSSQWLLLCLCALWFWQALQLLADGHRLVSGLGQGRAGRVRATWGGAGQGDANKCKELMCFKIGQDTIEYDGIG